MFKFYSNSVNKSQEHAKGSVNIVYTQHTSVNGPANIIGIALESFLTQCFSKLMIETSCFIQFCPHFVLQLIQRLWPFHFSAPKTMFPNI